MNRMCRLALLAVATRRLAAVDAPSLLRAGNSAPMTLAISTAATTPP